VNSKHSIAAHWEGDFDEAGLQAWAEALRQKLPPAPVSLGLVFMTPRFFPHAKQVLEILRVHGQIPLLLGCSSNSLIAGDREIEDGAGISLGLYSLPGAKLKAVHFSQEQLEEPLETAFWHHQTGVPPSDCNGWLAFVDPFNIDSESWLRTWSEAYAPMPVLGGLAGGDFSERVTQVYLNGEVFEEGGVAVAVGGDVELASVISQGCTPIGDTWTLTRVNQNIIQQIGNRPAYEVLAETVQNLSEEEQKAARGNLLIGLVVNEYLDEFHRGDFLIRNLLGADAQSGAIAVGALPRPGQTIQFQRRDAQAANEDMSELLSRASQKLTSREIYGACLCSCNGRGQNLFGQPNHDAAMVQERLGPMGLTGFFCSGEIGPIGERNFLHGFTASLAVFVKK
jgi:small ligand-binding sensory domain FIST